MNSEKREPMNILVTLDSNYVAPLTVMLSSMVRSNPGERFNIYVANSSLTDEDFAKIRASVETASCRVISVGVDARLLADAPVMDRISKETYYRLVAMDYLPEEVKRILYIDPDTVIINKLRPVYDTPLGDNLLAGSSHIYGWLNALNLKRLNMPKGSRYVNAGVLLMNIEGIRKEITSQEIFEYIRLNAKKLYLADQDVINALFGGKTVHLDPRVFNLDEKTYSMFKKSTDVAWVTSNTVIVHFNGKYKPWKDGYKGKLKGFYDEEYLRMTGKAVALNKAG